MLIFSPSHPMLRRNWKMNFTFLRSFFSDPSRSSRFFPMALLIRSIVHLFSQCIISLYVSITLLISEGFYKEFASKKASERAFNICKSSWNILEYFGLMNDLHFFFTVRWLEIFPREQLLLVNGDQLIEDPLSQIRRIEDFLGKINIFCVSFYVSNWRSLLSPSVNFNLFFPCLTAELNRTRREFLFPSLAQIPTKCLLFFALPLGLFLYGQQTTRETN